MQVPKRRRRVVPSRAERRVTYALKVVALVAVSLYLLVGVLHFLAAVRATGILVVGALLLSYIVYPMVRRLNEQLPLVPSILIVYAMFAGVVALALGAIVPALSNDIAGFVKAAPGLLTDFQHELTNPTNPLVARIPLADRLSLAHLPSQLDTLAQQYGAPTLQRGLGVVLSTFSIFAAFVVLPVIAAYMLIEASEVRRHLLGLFPATRRAKVDTLIDELDKVVGGFVRGQLIDGAIVGVMIFVMLTIMHVPYAVLIGVAAGVLNFIPYAGAVIGFVPAVILALAYNGPTNALIVALLFAVIQQIDGNFVAPRVMRDAVGLSPLYIIVAILLGTELFGLVGTFLAVPVAAMLRVLREQLLPAPVSRGEEPPELTPAPRRAAPIKAP